MSRENLSMEKTTTIPASTSARSIDRLTRAVVLSSWPVSADGSGVAIAAALALPTAWTPRHVRTVQKGKTIHEAAPLESIRQ
eukprot:scaffold20385_cov121-Isochrysis_galbana.AAC.2